MTRKRKHTGMYELLEAIEEAIEATTSEKRIALASTIYSYMTDCPEEFFWSVGPQAPYLLNHIMRSIDDMTAAGCYETVRRAA